MRAVALGLKMIKSCHKPSLYRMRHLRMHIIFLLFLTAGKLHTSDWRNDNKLEYETCKFITKQMFLQCVRNVKKVSSETLTKSATKSTTKCVTKCATKHVSDVCIHMLT